MSDDEVVTRGRVLTALRGRSFRVPRAWSNRELRRIGGLFDGDVVNVSAWRDEDKEGGHYRDYFPRARNYALTNYKPEARGFQGAPDEIFCDLEKPLDPALVGRFDVVFNHTVLEHVYEVQTAFRNLVALSRDVVIVVVPFLQTYHSDYGDFWRFTPLAIERMYRANGMEMLSCTFNENVMSAVYLFAIGSKHADRWRAHFASRDSSLHSAATGDVAGARAIPSLGMMRRLLARWGRSR